MTTQRVIRIKPEEFVYLVWEKSVEVFVYHVVGPSGSLSLIHPSKVAQVAAVGKIKIKANNLQIMNVNCKENAVVVEKEKIIILRLR